MRLIDTGTVIERIREKGYAQGAISSLNAYELKL
jgi:hypothetical protein